MKNRIVAVLLVLLMIVIAGQAGASAPSSAKQAQLLRAEGSNILVAYFSCTGNTRSLAEHMASSLNATLYEIMPATPYSTGDLDSRDKTSRSSIEQKDDSARPAISGAVKNMAEFDIVFLGYPVWFGQAPKIINTFLERYDFSGKTIIPFCTSGKSGIGSSATNLHRLVANSAVWLSGARLPIGATKNDVEKWIGSLDI